MRILTTILSVLLLLCFVVSINAATIHVPADSATIQSGIDGTVDGDTVLVADGTYTGSLNRNLDFCGKAVVVILAAEEYRQLKPRRKTVEVLRDCPVEGLDVSRVKDRPREVVL